MTIPTFRVSADALLGPDAVLTGAEFHHLRVRRLRIGSEVVLCDGMGRARAGVVTALDRRRALIRLQPDVPPDRESPLRLVLAQAVLKPDRSDLLVEKATELGVSDILFFTCSRSARQVSQARQERWQRLAQSAAKQSQRRVVPLIRTELTFADALASSASLRLLFWEHGRESLAQFHAFTTKPASVCAAVGPEGGFTFDEAQAALAAGWHVVGLGPRILRAETAALSALSLCQFFWGDLAAPTV